MSNYVIADIEWLDKGGFINPTQISAVKVNSNWQSLSHFSERIKPRSQCFYTWKHTAYTGGAAEAFLSARSAFRVLRDFDEWLDSGDIILWWFTAEKETYSALINSIHKRNPIQKQLVLRDYLDGFLSGNKRYKWSAYDTARAFKLSSRGKEHDSFADVLVVKDVLNAIKFPQELLKEPPAVVIETQKFIPMPYLRYAYDSSTNLLHLADGGCKFGCNVAYINNICNYIKKKILPCPVCLQKEYREQKRQMYLDIVERMHCRFIYTPRSKVFHKASCTHVHAALDVKGCRKYATAIKTGRRPCKICNPTVNDEQKRLVYKKRNDIPAKGVVRNVSKNETEKAVLRLKQAKEERSALDFKTIKTERERRDALTITGTAHGFFVGKGYNNFHLKSCPRVKQLSGIIGFRTYNDAISAGFTPCKTCKPTKKSNVNLSIPVTSKERIEEKISDLYTRCAAYGYSCSQNDEYFYVETPVGKWKIDITSKPVKLKHINLVVGGDTEEYHEQPRIFLSFTDAILYIRKHDKNLLT